LDALTENYAAEGRTIDHIIDIFVLLLSMHFYCPKIVETLSAYACVVLA